MNIRVGRNEEAIKVLKDALEIDSKYAEAYRLIGVAQLQLKQTKRLVPVSQKPRNWVIRMLML